MLKTPELSQEIEQAYVELEQCIGIIGWDYRCLFSNYYSDEIDDGRDDERELISFYEKHRKRKYRKAHSLSELKGFIDYVITHPEFIKKGVIKPVYLPDKNLSQQFEREIIKISKKITKIVEEANK